MTSLPSFRSRIGTAGLVLLATCLAAFPPPGFAAAPSRPTTADVELEEIIISAPEPKYVAPTKRDKIGRIWAPVYINDKGPFRLVLDTGASHTGIRASVVEALNMKPNKAEQVRVRGVTGTNVVSTIRVESLVMGDMELRGKKLPIITDPLGGAEGILGSEGMEGKRIYIDFINDFIRINRSRNEPAPDRFITLPISFLRGNLLTIDARIGRVPVKAIIDTGGEVTVANFAARDALIKNPWNPVIDMIAGATTDVQMAERYSTPPIIIGNIAINTGRTSFGDLHIFRHWDLTDEPAVLIGMDALGLLDTLIIDYQRAELQVKMRGPDSLRNDRVASSIP
jgi:hypothetical protein